MSTNPIYRDHNKDIVVDYHFVREWVAAGNLVVQYITSLQIADIFTKGLSYKQFLFLKCNLTSIPSIRLSGHNSVYGYYCIFISYTLL